MIFFSLLQVHCEDYYQLQLYKNTEHDEYYTNLYIGNPPQAQSVIIDNMKQVLMLNCEDCRSCHKGSRNFPYNYQRSTSGRYIECVYFWDIQKDQLVVCRSKCAGKTSSDYCKVDAIDNFGDYFVKLVSDQVRLQLDSPDPEGRPVFACTITENTLSKYEQNGVLGLYINQLNMFNSFFHLTGSEYIKEVGICLDDSGGYL